MAKSNAKTAKAETSAFPVTAGMMAASPAALRPWLEIFSESTRFVADRLQQDLATQKAMLSCKTPAELMKVQAEFYKTAMDQYSEEAALLFEMMSKATESSFKQAGVSLSRKYDDVPL